jgi:hypothetical protein
MHWGKRLAFWPSRRSCGGLGIPSTRLTFSLVMVQFQSHKGSEFYSTRPANYFYLKTSNFCAFYNVRDSASLGLRGKL